MFAWLAEKLLPYLLPFIAAEVRKQLEETRGGEPKPTRFIGKS